MVMIRNLLPTDVVALVAFYSRSIPNQAQLRSHLERGSDAALNPGALLEQWLTAENRKALVAVEGLTAIRGLLTARQRDGKSVWEIERFMVEDDDEEIATDLLEDLAQRLSGSQTRRIFLRLPLDSPPVTAARQAGYFPYLSETLLQSTSTARVKVPADMTSSAIGRKKGDAYGLFRLYCTSVPTIVQMNEGATLEEWTEGQEASFGHQREYVWATDGQPWAWLRSSEHSPYQQIQLLVHPSANDATNDLVQYALSLAPKGGKTLALVPDHQIDLQRTLTRNWGFEEVAHYVALVRQLTVRVPAVQLAPART